MKAVILAAGKGTRMRDLTSALPKPMLKVWNKPILEHILTGLITAGIREVFIVTGYRADTIEDYFGSGDRWGVKIEYGRQAVQDGTGKAPEVAKSFVGTDDFLLTYGDILVKPETYRQMVRRFMEADFSGLITVTRGKISAKKSSPESPQPNCHKADGDIPSPGGEGQGEGDSCLPTLHAPHAHPSDLWPLTSDLWPHRGRGRAIPATAVQGEDVMKGGVVLFDQEFCLDLLIEKPTPAQVEDLRRAGKLKPGGPIWYNAGVYVFRPVVYDFTARLQKSPRGEYELTDAIIAMRSAGHRLAGLEIAGRWVDVRDPEVLAALEKESGQ